MDSPEMAPQMEEKGMAMMREYFLIASRNRWTILGCITLSVAVAWGYCAIAQKYYQSETLIVAEGTRGIESVLGTDLEGNFEQRLFLIQRRIASPDFLSEIVREFGLLPDGLDEQEEMLFLQDFAKQIQIDRITTRTPGTFTGPSTIEAFTVSFMHKSPGMAMQVAARIADKFIEENTREREKDAEGTAEFLDDELRWMKLELEKKEANISRFKKEHIGDLPQQADTNLRTLDRIEGEIADSTEERQRHSDRLAMLEKAVEEYHSSGRKSPALRGTFDMEPDPLFHRLTELREKLITLEAEFFDGYPEVILTKEEIRKVEAELRGLYGQDATKPGKKPLDPYVQDLLKQQSEERSELNLLRQRLANLQATRRDIQQRVERSPQVEQQLLVLERDYANMKSNYAALLDKRLQARVAENMEKRQKSGKFRILDQADFPNAPIIPNRSRVLVLGFLFGAVLGAGLSVLRERLTPQFRGPEDVELLLMGPRLLAAIPNFSSLWGPSKDRRYLQNPYGQKRPLVTAKEAQSGLPARDQRSNFRSNGFHTDKRFVAKLFPHSMASEQYRVAAARLQLINMKGAPMVAAVTSAIKGEGKTTTIINLGYTLARDFAKRVLLLDCDFVFPELAHFAETPAKFGLVDCLKSDVPLEQAMSSFEDVPCWIMPAGESLAEQNELLRAGQLDRVLSQLRENFDYILLNAPPILPVATMNVLERYSDLLVLVVRANLTSRQAVTQALGSLRASKPIHVILNGVSTNALPNYMADYSTLGSSRMVG